MKINTVNENRIDIYLSEDEINDIFGGYELIDYDAPDCRMKIHNLLAAAIPDMLLPLNCERVLIEVKPKRYGCVITFTKIYGAVKKLRRISSTKTISLIFENSDNLVSSVGALDRLSLVNSELYTYLNKYAVIANVKGNNSAALLHISEYCKIDLGEISAVRIREYWQPICKKNAITHLSNAFLN